MGSGEHDAGGAAFEAAEAGPDGVGPDLQPAAGEPLLQFRHGGPPLGRINQPGDASVRARPVAAKRGDHADGLLSQRGPLFGAEARQHGRRHQPASWP